MEKKKILLVEDEVDLADISKKLLERHGFDVDIACDGQEALNKVTESTSLVLLDLMIGKVDGFMVCSLLKKNKKYEHIPVIIVTACGQNEDKARGLMLGAERYLIKPVKFDDLLMHITAVIKPIDGTDQNT